MCGIAGCLGAPLGVAVEEAILASLHHRGPDGKALKRFVDATLLHTRLEVLDLTPAATQPFASADQSVWTVFNGEIYNHHDLRRGLAARGYHLRTRCDTEVIPYLYIEHGPSFVELLRGMFALAVLDLTNGSLLLARDRHGMKPLFIAAGRHRLAFASEIAALRHVPDVSWNVNEQAVYDFVALRTIPAPATMYAGVESLLPGTSVTYPLPYTGASSGVRRTFHKFAIRTDSSMSLDEAADRTTHLLGEAVASQLESDVPLGGFLSGGIDSSLVAAAARDTGNPFDTFSVRFSEPGFDETDAALWVASRLGTRHHLFDFDASSADWDAVMGILTAAGQPFGDPSIFAMDSLARAVRATVTVALAGDGGDEGFGGYDHYRRAGMLSRALLERRGLRRAVSVGGPLTLQAAGAARLAPPNLGSRLRDLLVHPGASGLLTGLLSWIRPVELGRAWVGPPMEPVTRHFERQWEHDLGPDASVADRLSALMTEVDVRVRLSNDYLPKVDIASMRAGLEVRLPFLDEDLFSLGLSLPRELRVGVAGPKAVLRRVAAARLDQIAPAPKHGFAVPVDAWMGEGLRRQIGGRLSRAASPLRSFLSPSWLGTVADAFANETPVLGLSRQAVSQRAVMLLSLDHFLDRSA